jgi:hypothetical protein
MPNSPVKMSFYDGANTVIALCPKPEELVWGVENELKSSFDTKLIAPVNWRWKKAAITPIDLTVEFIQGISPGLGQNENPSFEKMEAMVKNLLNMAMPSQRDFSVRTIRMSAFRDGAAWFSRQGVLKSANVTWEGPFDAQGRPFKAIVALSMVAHYGPVGQYSTKIARRGNMPQRGKFTFKKG